MQRRGSRPGGDGCEVWWLPEQQTLVASTRLLPRWAQNCLLVRNMHVFWIKTAVRYHLIPVRTAIILKNLQITNAREGVEKRKPSYTVGGNVNWCSHYGEEYRGSSKKLKSCDGIQQSYCWTYIQTDTCTLMFIAALFTKAKTWKQPTCPLTDEWINKMWCVYIYQ